MQMIVCSCNMLSDRDVRRVVTGARARQLTAGQVYDRLHCGARCGRCARTIKRIMQEALARCEAGCACCPRPTPGADTNARPRDVIWDGGTLEEQQSMQSRSSPRQALQQIRA